MIKYNNSNINDWFFSTDNIIKVYRNNAICYYKIDSTSPSGQTPCYAVVENISQYTDREFVDVFNKADGKWFKLNNLNQYEEYGIYGSGRNITYYDGKLTIDDGYEYQYSGNSWVNVGEVSGGTATLPDVPFTLNYNAKNYDASTHTIPYTEGALNAIDAVITGTTANIIDHHEDGYIQLTGSSSTAIRALVGTTNFSRSSSNPNITIVCKAYTPGSSTEGNILSNRKESYNWMYRHKSSILTFHGQSEQGSIAVSNTEPNTCSVRIDSSRLLRYNNWTQDTTSTYSNFTYGSNSNGGALFAGYYSSGGEMWKGVFYWIYMSLNTLTDEQVQQVIAYNEGGGGEPEYPKYYDEIQDPPNNLSFSSMTEAEEYECPWVGMTATIDGVKYVFSGDSQSGYEWVYNPSRLPVGYTEVEYITSENISTSVSGPYIDTNFTPNQNTRVVMDYQPMINGQENRRIFGSGEYNTLGYVYNMEGSVGQSNCYYYYKFDNGSSWKTSTLHPDLNRHVVDFNKEGKIWLDDTAVITLPSTSFTCSYNLGLFNEIGPAMTLETVYEYFQGRVYSCQVYDNGTLVRDLVPCIKDSDNTVGAYDIVNDVFYTVPTGYTTDRLIAGNPV